MVTEPLVSQNNLPENARLAGRFLLSSIDREGIQIVAAFWMYIDEEDQWRLCLATPAADTIGPLEIYKAVRRLLDVMPDEERSGLNLSDVAVVSPNNLIIGNLRRRYGTVSHEDDRRIRRVDGPYIYRL